MDSVRTIFILSKHYSTPSEASDLMLHAFEICKQHHINALWLEEDNFESLEYSQSDIVIFEKFEGKCFQTLKEKQCGIMGPLCVSVCIEEEKAIPDFNWPIYNVAMARCVVCCSLLPKSKKAEIKSKVELMGGSFKDDFVSSVTHLVTGSVISEKYVQAAEAGIKIMTTEWVEEVWKLSQNANIHCDNKDFNKFRCLPFYNLSISSTGITDSQLREDLKKKIESHGGVLTNNMVITKTKVLIVYGAAGTLSAKFKAARKNDLRCVTIDWVYDSIEKGYALPESNYSIKKLTSTPTKSDETNPNFSIISVIGGSDNVTKLDETILSTRTNIISTQKRKGTHLAELEDIINNLDIKKAKKSGQFLDGCSVFLVGFNLVQREKLCKILNWSGATRYDDISERLTHIIIGDTSCPEFKIVKAKNSTACLVSIRWLLDSLEKRQPVDEEDYLINLNDAEKELFSSPIGRKGLNLLRSSKTIISTVSEASNVLHQNSGDNQAEENYLLSQYSCSSQKDDEADTLARLLQNVESNFDVPEQISNDVDTASTINQQGDIFNGKRFVLKKFSQEETAILIEEITNGFGTVLPKTFKGIADYIVTPICLHEHVQDSALEIVNELWVADCLQNGELCDILYFHRPVVLTNSKPLSNCVITISNYVKYERDFLTSLVENLGGVCQDQFSRVSHPDKNILPATHLICSDPNGKKYQAALKWGLPVVYKDWLIECASLGKIIEENKYLVGDAKALNRSEERSKSNIEQNNCSADSIKQNPNNSNNIPSSSKWVKSILTPSNHRQSLNKTSNENTPINKNTPVNKILEQMKTDDCQNSQSPQRCSQVTPVSKIIEEARRNNLLDTPDTPVLVKTSVDTPESPYGYLISPNLSANSKKQIKRYIDKIPYNPAPQCSRRNSTPLEVVKRRCLNALFGVEQQNVSEDHLNQTPKNHKDETVTELKDCAQNLFLSTKIKELEEAVKSSAEKRRTIENNIISVPRPEYPESSFVGRISTQESQPFTVGWDYSEQPAPVKAPVNRIFIISGIENEARQALIKKIKSLQAEVSDSMTSDPNCTHLICQKPARNEKTLACIAAGKWILHLSYIEKSVEAGMFLDEEDFEFGNPRFYQTIHTKWDKETESRMEAIYWWRCEIKRRGYGAFNDMRAIVVAQKRDPIVRVIEAGGGIVYDIKPPFDDSVLLTHCLLELRTVSDYSIYNSLAKKRVFCVNTLYISDFLFRTSQDVRDSILPSFSSFYRS